MQDLVQYCCLPAGSAEACGGAGAAVRGRHWHRAGRAHAARTHAEQSRRCATQRHYASFVIFSCPTSGNRSCHQVNMGDAISRHAPWKGRFPVTTVLPASQRSLRSTAEGCEGGTVPRTAANILPSAYWMFVMCRRGGAAGRQARRRRRQRHGDGAAGGARGAGRRAGRGRRRRHHAAGAQQAPLLGARPNIAVHSRGPRGLALQAG